MVIEPANEDGLMELEDSPYLRRQKQVDVRRGKLKGRTAARVKIGLLITAVVSVIGFATYQLVRFGLYDSRFLVGDSRIEVAGLKYVTRAQIAEKFAGDIGRSIFSVPLARRRAMIEEISWVERASVARAWPDKLRVTIRERVPV